MTDDITAIQEADLNKELEKAGKRTKKALEDFDKEGFLEEKIEDTTSLIEELNDKKGSKLLPVLTCLCIAGAVFYAIRRLRSMENGKA
jgi:hypothetical protein